MFQPPPLITLRNATLRQPAGLIGSELTLRIRAGECWAVVGPVASGKTSLLRALAGQLPTHPTGAREVASGLTVAFVSFREESRQFSYDGYFYQQRYHATMSAGGYEGANGAVLRPVPTVRSLLNLPDTPAARATVARLGLTNLLDTPLLKLSNGQTRRVRIGRALLQQPAVLLLDNPFVGLDARFRAELTDWLGTLVTNGLTCVLAAEPDALPPFVTHVLALRPGQQPWQGPVANFMPVPSAGDLPALPVRYVASPPVDFDEAFRLTDVTVRYGDLVILDRINWRVRPGEGWALLGPNGAGKSVLLSLLYGDHPQAYANDVRVFDHRRGRPIGGRSTSVWDVKRRIGFVSPELHLYFPAHLTVRQVALTGLTDSLRVPNYVPAAVETAAVEADLLALLVYFELGATVTRPFGTLSAGQQRLVLLVRALLKNAPVLLLDEPFQALDRPMADRARRLLGSLTDKTLLFVTHDPAELPDSVGYIAELSGGQLLSYGRSREIPARDG